MAVPWQTLPNERFIILLSEYGTYYLINVLYFDADGVAVMHSDEKLFARELTHGDLFYGLRDKLARELGPMFNLVPGTWCWVL